MKNKTEKIVRFIMSSIIGFSFGMAVSEFAKNEQWGFVFLTVMIVAFGFSIMLCVWKLIDYSNENN